MGGIRFYNGISSGAFELARIEYGQGVANVNDGYLKFFVGNSGSFTNALTIDQFTNSTFTGSIAIGNSVASSIAAPSTHKVSILINGVQYYLLASNV
jgi:acyl-CoA reductase-like NAD-dependent aldehyde dehydrogenase